MNKNFKNLSIYLSIYLSIFNLTRLNSQTVPPIIGLLSCYQSVSPFNGKSIKLLKSKNSAFQFTLGAEYAVGNIEGYAITNLNNPAIITTNPNINPYGINVKKSKTSPLTQYVNLYGINNSNENLVTFTFDSIQNYDSFEVAVIRKYQATETYSFLYKAEKIKVKFIDSTDLNIEIKPKNGKSCITFDDPNFDVTFPELEGFCGVTYAKYSISSPQPHLGLPSNFSTSEVQLFTPYYPFPPMNADCSRPQGIFVPPNLPNPVPFKCVDFDLNIEIRACDGNDDVCPPIKVKKQFKICCNCDIRPNQPPY